MDLLDWLTRLSRDAAPVVPGGEFDQLLMDRATSPPPGFASNNPVTTPAGKVQTQNPPGWQDQIQDGSGDGTPNSNDAMPGVAPQGPLKDYQDTGVAPAIPMPDQGEVGSGLSSGPASTPGDTHQPGTRWWWGDGPGVPVKMADYTPHTPILSADQAARFAWAMLLDGHTGDTVGRGQIIPVPHHSPAPAGTNPHPQANAPTTNGPARAEL